MLAITVTASARLALAVGLNVLSLYPPMTLVAAATCTDRFAQEEIFF
jgi:hypothetical protein